MINYSFYREVILWFSFVCLHRRFRIVLHRIFSLCLFIHFSLASYTLIFTFGAVAVSVASPFIGKGLAKVNFKVMYMVGIIISSLAYVIFGISSKLPEFYGAAILCMIGSTFFSGQGVQPLVPG